MTVLYNNFGYIKIVKKGEFYNTKMNYKIDTKSNISAYIQLYQYFRDDIVQGVYPYKSKLPPKRTTCAETNLSLVTVEHYYDLFIQEGYV